MKIAYIRGDFLSSWEISNSIYLAKHHDFTLFFGKYPVNQVGIPPEMKVVSLWSPADLNFGKVSRYKMAVLNRLFVDAHMLFGLDEKLKGFDIAYVSETYYGFTHQALEAKKKGFVKKVVSHASENTPFNNEGIRGRKEFKNQAIAEMDKFVAITDGAKNVLLKEGCSPEKIVRLNPGIDLKLFKPQKVREFRSIRKNDHLELLFVGRLIPEKGILELLKIFENISQRHPKLDLIIVGLGPLEKTITDFAKTHANVYYLGAIDYQDMPKVYGLSDIYLHFSTGSKTWVEQYGFTILEAMASGLPVMGLNKGSVSELVNSGGFVVDQAKYSSILEKLITDNTMRRNVSRAALKLARKEYDAEEHAKDLEKLFRKTLQS